MSADIETDAGESRMPRITNIKDNAVPEVGRPHKPYNKKPASKTRAFLLESFFIIFLFVHIKVVI